LEVGRDREREDLLKICLKNFLETKSPKRAKTGRNWARHLTPSWPTLQTLKKFQTCQLFFTRKKEIIIEIDLYQVRAVVQNKRFLDIGEFKEKKWVIRHL
jgi:hypothetical protein